MQKRAAAKAQQDQREELQNYYDIEVDRVIPTAYEKKGEKAEASFYLETTKIEMAQLFFNSQTGCFFFVQQNGNQQHIPAGQITDIRLTNKRKPLVEVPKIVGAV
jgi:hypothetical protein